LIRTGHAARALRRHDTPARRGELALGLAYWAARYTELPSGERTERGDLRETLASLEHPWLEDHTDVEFDDVLARLTGAPLAPAVRLGSSRTVASELDGLVRESALAFLEMLVQERSRIWLLHTVTGPAAVEMLLPELDAATASRLVAYARQAVVGLYAAYGAPYAVGAHVRSAPPAWPDLIEPTARSGSVHTIKLTEALVRFDRDGDPLWRSVAAQWLEWT